MPYGRTEAENLTYKATTVNEQFDVNVHQYLLFNTEIMFLTTIIITVPQHSMYDNQNCKTA